MKPLDAALALSATVALFYSLCTLVELAWSNQFMAFINTWFHGLDYGKLTTSDSFNLASFIYAFVIIVLWALAFGAFFAFIHNMLFRVRRRFHMMQHE